MVVVLAVVDTPEAEVEVQGLAVATSAVEQDSVLVDGFYPYDDYYAYDDQDYYGYDASTDPYSVSTVSAVQSDLAKQGYYRGVIDGIYGPQTRVAITRYQSNHGLQVTGSLTTATLQSLGLPQPMGS